MSHWSTKLSVDERLDAVTAEVRSVAAATGRDRLKVGRLVVLASLILSFLSPRMLITGDDPGDPERSFSVLGLLSMFDHISGGSQFRDALDFGATVQAASVVALIAGSVVLFLALLGTVSGPISRPGRITIRVCAALVLIGNAGLILTAWAVGSAFDQYNPWQLGFGLSVGAAVGAVRYIGAV